MHCISATRKTVNGVQSAERCRGTMSWAASSHSIHIISRRNVLPDLPHFKFRAEEKLYRHGSDALSFPAIAGQGGLCVGKDLDMLQSRLQRAVHAGVELQEWYRFPSSFFLPSSEARLPREGCSCSHTSVQRPLPPHPPPLVPAFPDIKRAYAAHSAGSAITTDRILGT